MRERERERGPKKKKKKPPSLLRSIWLDLVVVAMVGEIWVCDFGSV